MGTVALFKVLSGMDDRFRNYSWILNTNMCSNYQCELTPKSPFCKNDASEEKSFLRLKLRSDWNGGRDLTLNKKINNKKAHSEELQEKR